MKHGVRVHAVNLYTDEVGNPEVPQKFEPVAAAVSAASAKPGIPKWTAIGSDLDSRRHCSFSFLGNEGNRKPLRPHQ